MKVFGIGIVVAIALAAIAATGLSLFQETVAQAYSTEADRLNSQESVNLYGRQLIAEDPSALPTIRK
jgi:hypothetical protein